jgi:DNA-binding transcriptional ArsR family regulator
VGSELRDRRICAANLSFRCVHRLTQIIRSEGPKPRLGSREYQIRCVPIGSDGIVYFLIVDLSDPTRAVTATLDGPVLAVLAQAGKPLTAGEVAAQTPRGSEIGVRRSLTRLTEQGIVRATEMGRNRVHELNRDHLAAPVAVTLSGLRLELWKRLRSTLSGWNPKPAYACVFGSAARGDGDSDSDIDLLLVHAPLPGESERRRRSGGMEPVAALAAELMAVQLTERQAAKWRRQVDELRGLVRDWTGNPLQALELSTFQWADHRRQASTLFEEITRDGIELTGAGR